MPSEDDPGRRSRMPTSVYRALIVLGSMQLVIAVMVLVALLTAD